MAAVSSAGFGALAVSISQCLHVLSSKALQISRVLASTKLNMHIFNPFMCSTFTGEAELTFTATVQNLTRTTVNGNQNEIMLK